MKTTRTFTWRCFLYILMAKSGSSTVQYNLREIKKAFTRWDFLCKYQLNKIYILMNLMILDDERSIMSSNLLIVTTN